MAKNEYMTKWARIEEQLLINSNISKKVLNDLEKAYKKDISEKEQEKIINKVYKQLFTSDMEVIKWLKQCKTLKKKQKDLQKTN